LKFLRILTVILLALFMQGPAMLVQEVGWVNMLVTYSQERGLKRGIIETFDGEHPCEMCKMAENIRQQSNDPDESDAPQNTRSNMAWPSMMISAGEFQPPVPKFRDMLIAVAGWLSSCKSRGADGPETPPPRWA
jgi:hypothetical protein